VGLLMNVVHLGGEHVRSRHQFSLGA
jgi:hypothetical protein